MPKLKMTDAVVQRQTAAPGERVDYFDDHPRDRQRGLVLRVSGSTDKDGRDQVRRTWAVFCRVKGSKKLRRFTIGPYPETGLGEARDQAAEIIKGARREGIDPVQKRKEAEVKAELEGKDTIEAVVALFVKHMRTRPKKNGAMRAERYVDETERNFNNHVLPRWRGKNVREIARRDVAELLEAIEEGGSTVRDRDGERRHIPGGAIAANRTLAAIRALFNWALRRGIIESTPAALVEAGAETSRDRALSDDESRVLWPQFKAAGYPIGHFFCLALATGQRRSEVAGMRWADIDEKAATWTIPEELAKARREHVVPLSDLALDILRDAKDAARALAKARAAELRLDKIPELGTYVFTTRADRPISGYSKAKTAVDEAVARAQKKAGRKDLDHWTIHDLRRTAATGMGKLGTDRFTIGRVLNHADNSITGVYDRHAYLDEKAAALRAWGRHLSAITKPRLATTKQRGAA